MPIFFSSELKAHNLLFKEFQLPVSEGIMLHFVDDFPVSSGNISINLICGGRNNIEQGLNMSLNN